MPTPQYLENNLSPVTKLPDSISFDKIFNLSMLLATGYELIDNSKKTSVSKPIHQIVSIGDTLPAFRLFDLDSVETTSTSFTDGLVLLDFWYKSCAPCLMALPALERLHQQYKDHGLQVLGINGTDKDPLNIKKFLHSREVSYSTLLEPEKVFSKQLHITAYPTIVIFEAKTRKVLLVQEGFSKETELRIAALVTAYLKDSH